MESHIANNNCFRQPKTMAELLPGLSGILSKEAMQSLTAKKQPRRTLVTRTAEKVVKPLTLAEMKAEIQSLKIDSPRRYAPGATSSKKKAWNSSVKVDKRISHTADGQMKNNPVRKVLNFQPSKPRLTQAFANLRMTMNHGTPKFLKPESKIKKITALGKNNIRISGINHIPETPIQPKKPLRYTLANKENINRNNNYNVLPPPKPFLHKKLARPAIPDTPMSNDSWKSSCDSSFLNTEKEVQDIVDQNKAKAQDKSLENIEESNTPASTPFKEYRNVQEYFNNSGCTENSLLNDNTIMCFDKPLDNGKPIKREESVIVSLCDMLNKASLNVDNSTSQLHDLIEVEKQTIANLQILEIAIQTLNKIKDSQLKSLMHITKLIQNKKLSQSECENNKIYKESLDNTALKPKFDSKELKESCHENSLVIEKPCSVMKHVKSPSYKIPKSPSYKIPKKHSLLRQKVFHKSMPNISNMSVSPCKDKALNMYMKMKETLNFLNTPMKSRIVSAPIPDTPSISITSHNLKKQLDKLYNNS